MTPLLNQLLGTGITIGCLIIALIGLLFAGVFLVAVVVV